jgi:D-3-phosphoglycerate dehydrogenase / 2-oxoglutarate reductase
VALAVSPTVRLAAGDVAALPDLRIVAATSAGYDHIDVAAVVAAGACVTNAPGYCDVEVADHVIAMTGTLLRRLHVADAMMRQGRFSSRAAGARRITGAALSVVGLGRIGTLVAQRGLALGMRVIAWAPRTPEARIRELGAVPCARLETLLAASDVVTLHLPLTSQTKAIIDADALAAMRPGSCLVNCGRGELVDLPALRSALEAGPHRLRPAEHDPHPAPGVALTGLGIRRPRDGRPLDRRRAGRPLAAAPGSGPYRMTGSPAGSRAGV